MKATASTLPERRSTIKRKSRKKRDSGGIGWWPLIAGIAVTPFALKAATLLALTGPAGLCLLYPWMLIPKLHFLGFSDSLANTLSQIMMYLQFPLYGLFAVLTQRRKGTGTTVLHMTLLHLLAVGLVFVAARW